MKLDFESRPLKRIIGEVSNGESPTLFCLAGIHGNEIAGIKALHTVFEIIQSFNMTVNGTFVGVSGNLSALKVGKRFIDIDMNRQWDRENIERILSFTNGEAAHNEENEMKQVVELLHQYRDKDPNNFLFFDLHTTSAFGGVFSIINNVRRSLIYARSLNIPVLTGIHNVLEGTSLNYLEEKGIAAVGFEAGQHDAPGSVDNMIASIFIMLAGMGILKGEEIPHYHYYNKHMHQFGEGLPQVVEFLYRHEITDEDDFRMKHGYENFQKITANEHIADDKSGQIVAPNSGMILMPLYQKQGSDGFFIVKEISSSKFLN